MKQPSQLVISVVLAMLAALAPFAIDTYLPAFPTLATALGGTTLELQQSLTAYLLPYALMTLWHGALSDAIGRLGAIRWGLGIFALASIGCALAPNVETLWFFRAVQGASAGAGNVVARAMVRDLFEGVAAQRVMAQVQMLFGLAPAVAPIIGGWLLGIHWQAIFVFLFLYAMLALLAAQRILPETVVREKRVPLSAKQVLTGYGKVFCDFEFIKLVVAFGYMFVPTVCGMVLGSFLARRSAGRFSARAIARFAYGWMAGAVLLNIAVCLWLPTSLWFNIAPIALYNVGMAFALPVMSIAALDRAPRLRGTAASAQAFVQMLLSTVSAGLLIPLLWFSPLGLALGMGGYLLLGWLCARNSVVWRQGELVS